MSELTREQILKLIEENGGPEGLDLSGKDLSEMDLSWTAIRQEATRLMGSDSKERPAWIGREPESARGINGINLAESRLIGANLQGINLVGADMQEANLTDANLERANLMLARLQNINLERANLRNTELTCSILRGARLIEANFQGASLNRVDLRGADLVWANFQGADLSYSHLEKVDLFGAESLEGVYFYNAFLDDTRMRREQLGEAIGEELDGRYDEAKEAYLALKNNFAEIGRYRDESWAYVKERQMGKMMHHPRLARKYYGEELPENPDVWQLGWFYIRHTTKWALDWIVEWTCGYGESVLRTLRAMGVALVGFAILYRLLNAVVDVSGNPSSTWLHCLLYSGGAFTTFGVDTLRPANDWIRALSILESVVGIALTGLLGFVLGNRIRRS